MKKCPKCGAELDDQVRFCYQCGEMLGETGASAAGAAADDDDDEDNMQTIIIGGSTEEEEDASQPVNNGQAPIPNTQAPWSMEPPQQKPAGAGEMRPASQVPPAGAPEMQGSAAGQQGNPEFQSAVFCPNCGHRNIGGELFCEECGSRLDGSDIASGAAGNAGGAGFGAGWQNDGAAVAGDGKKGPGKGKIIKIVAGVAAAAAVAAVAFLVVPKVLSGVGGGKSGAGKDLTRAVYYTEDGLFFADLKKKKDQSKLVTEDLARKGSTYRMAGSQCITDDGKYLYYVEDVDNGKGDLKRIKVSDIGKKNKTGEEVASNISDLSILESGHILFTKGGKMNLIPDGNLKKVEKLFDADECEYVVDGDGKSVVWAEPKKSGEKWDLYYQAFGKKPVLLKEGIKGTRVGIHRNEESLGTFYLTVNKDNGSMSVLKYTNDGKETEIESKADSVVAYFDESLYYSKTDKDGDSTIYFWNGKDSEKVMKVRLENTAYHRKGGAVLIVDAGASDKDDRTWYILRDGKEVAKGDCASDDFSEFGSSFCYDKGGKRYLMTAREKDEERDTLYELKDGDSKLNEVAKDAGRVSVIGDDVYWICNKDDDGLGDLVKNDKTIADDVKTFTASQDFSGVFVYNEDSDLSVVKGGKKNDICDDVSRTIMGNENSVLVLYDYSDGAGTLGYYNGKDLIKISDDVCSMSR